MTKHWSVSFSISLSSEYLGLLSLKIGWFDLLAVQGTFRSLLQHYLEGINSLAFCLLHGPALTTVCDHWEDHSLDYMDLCGTLMSLIFNTLSRFVITFLPKSNHLLISWLQSLSTVNLEPKKRKSGTISTFFPSICHAVMGPDVMILVFYYSALNLLFHSPPSPSSRGSLVPLLFLPLE